MSHPRQNVTQFREANGCYTLPKGDPAQQQLRGILTFSSRPQDSRTRALLLDALYNGNYLF